MTENRTPLEGIRVLDIGTMAAGPAAATLLADFGAEVIKIERPDGGDTLRNVGQMMEGESLYWAVDARNKKSITIDFHKKEGQELYKQLVKKSDVVVENFRPGTMEKWNIGYETLKEINPQIILCSVSGYGQTGPYSKRIAYDRMGLAFSGLLYMSGFEDRIPVKPGLPMADYLTAVYAAFSIMLTLFHRKNTNKGQHIDLALYEAVYRWTEALTASYDKFGIIRERTGNIHHAGIGGHFVSSDNKYMVITGSNNAIFKRLCIAMNKEELINDPRYDSHQKRVQHIEYINSLIAEWVSSNKCQDIVKICDEAGIPCSMMYNIKDIVEDPHYQARESFVNVKHPRLGDIRMPNVFPKLSESPGEIRSSGPLLGEHNNEIFNDILGLSDEELKKLKEIGVI